MPHVSAWKYAVNKFCVSHVVAGMSTIIFSCSNYQGVRLYETLYAVVLQPLGIANGNDDTQER